MWLWCRTLTHLIKAFHGMGIPRDLWGNVVGVVCPVPLVLNFRESSSTIFYPALAFLNLFKSQREMMTRAPHTHHERSAITTRLTRTRSLFLPHKADSCQTKTAVMCFRGSVCRSCAAQCIVASRLETTGMLDQRPVERHHIFLDLSTQRMLLMRIELK